MLIRTVKDLRAFLESKKITPEQFAPMVQLSHMTIRRLLRESDKKKISPKYFANFDAATGSSEAGSFSGKILPVDAQDFGSLMSDLEEKGRAVKDLDAVSAQVDEKFKLSQIGRGLRARIDTLFKAISDKSLSPKVRLLAIGALIYFLDPFDIIPDALVGVGYIDDFSVISLVLGAIVASKK